jgi:hypothetical protein
MRAITCFLLASLFAAFTLPASAQDETSDTRHRRLWKWSMVALVACTAFDSATSVNNPEGNPMLRSSNGQFGYRGLLLKSAMASGTIAFELRFSRRPHMYKPLAIFNFVQAGVFGGAAAYNSTFFGKPKQ